LAVINAPAASMACTGLTRNTAFLCSAREKIFHDVAMKSKIFFAY